MEKTTLYLPTDLQRSLREAARRAGRPQADLVRDALVEYLGKQPRPLPKSIGAVSSGAVAGKDSEDLLRAEWGKRADR